MLVYLHTICYGQDQISKSACYGYTRKTVAEVVSAPSNDGFLITVNDSRMTSDNSRASEYILQFSRNISALKRVRWNDGKTYRESFTHVTLTQNIDVSIAERITMTVARIALDHL